MVSIAGTNLCATTSSTGEYVLRNLPIGIFTLNVTRIGYSPSVIADVRVTAGETRLKDVVLGINPLALSSIEVVRGQAAAALYGQRAVNGAGASRAASNVNASSASVIDAVPENRGTGAAEEAYSRSLFSPDLVMKNQGQIGLTESQRTRIVREMSQAQTRFTEIQWTLSGEEEKLARLLEATSPAEASAISQLDKIMSLEQELKRAQMSLLLRIKSVLTEEQQMTLTRIRGR